MDEIKYREKIGELFKMLRKSKNMTQTEVSEELKCSLKHYNELELGKGGSFDFVMSVLTYYGCHIEIKTPPRPLKFNIGAAGKNE